MSNDPLAQALGVLAQWSAGQPAPTVADMLKRNITPEEGTAYQRNKQYARPGPYQTMLPADQEAQFRQWVQANRVPFDPNNPTSDYDMRGFWQDQAARQQGTQTNPNDGLPHYPDTYKTPFHQSFSNESRYALPTAPRWANDHQLVDQYGRVLFDERVQARHRR